jgi:hypothetical protein
VTLDQAAPGKPPGLDGGGVNLLEIHYRLTYLPKRGMNNTGQEAATRLENVVFLKRLGAK